LTAFVYVIIKTNNNSLIVIKSLSFIF
jgi:hypothetical protein